MQKVANDNNTPSSGDNIIHTNFGGQVVPKISFDIHSVLTDARDTEKYKNIRGELENFRSFFREYISQVDEGFKKYDRITVLKILQYYDFLKIIPGNQITQKIDEIIQENHQIISKIRVILSTKLGIEETHDWDKIAEAIEKKAA